MVAATPIGAESLIEWSIREASAARARVEELKKERDAAPLADWDRYTRMINKWLIFALHCDEYVERHASSHVPEIRNAIRGLLGIPTLRSFQRAPACAQELVMKLRYGMFQRTGHVVACEALDDGGRRIKVQLDQGKPDTATIELTIEDLRVLVGQPTGAAR